MRPPALATALLLATAGCSDATGSVQGGDPLLVAPDASPVEGGMQCPPASPTWQGLYGCYFGPTGQASCTAAAICHGDSSGLGAQSSGYICGHSAHACWMGMTATGSIVPAGGATDATTTALYVAIRKFDGSGTMPKNSVYTFEKPDVDAIAAWIQGGAKEN